MEKYKQVKTNSLRLGPTVRWRTDDQAVEEMALSITRHGLINAIEVDETGMIITGQIRWLAAKKAGLATVPVKVIERPDEDAIEIRQVVENTIRTGLGAARVGEVLLARQKKMAWTVTELAEEIGMSPEQVADYISLTYEGERVRAAVNAGQASMQAIIQSNRFPEEAKERVKEKIITRQAPPYALERLRKAVEAHPDKADELLDVDLTSFDAVGQMREVTGDEPPEVIAPFPMEDKLEKALQAARYALGRTHYRDARAGARLEAKWLREALDKWLDYTEFDEAEVEDAEVKELEDGKR